MQPRGTKDRWRRFGDYVQRSVSQQQTGWRPFSFLSIGRPEYSTLSQAASFWRCFKRNQSGKTQRAISDPTSPFTLRPAGLRPPQRMACNVKLGLICSVVGRDHPNAANGSDGPQPPQPPGWEGDSKKGRTCKDGRKTGPSARADRVGRGGDRHVHWVLTLRIKGGQGLNFIPDGESTSIFNCETS